jgi:glucans biosynthesis protein
MGWLAMPKLPDGLGMTIATRSGASVDGRRRVFQIDFTGASEQTDGLRVDLGASAGRISSVMLLPNPGIHGLRASFELDPNGADLIELRLRVMRDNRPLTETWLYRWTAS